jgi:hypothetical protein
VRQATLDTLKKVVRGEITNWRELGGPDLPIRLARSPPAASWRWSRPRLLAGQRPGLKNIIYVNTPVQLVQVMEQEPGVLGFAQLSLVKQRGIPEIVTDRPGDDAQPRHARRPTPALRTVIEGGAAHRQQSDVAVDAGEPPNLPAERARRLRRQHRAKLYFFATLSIVAVVALAGSSIYCARVTEVAAVRLYDQGFPRHANSARLGLLLEQHRRIVESMPSEVDRQRIDKALRELDDTRRRSSRS